MPFVPVNRDKDQQIARAAAAKGIPVDEYIKQIDQGGWISKYLSPALWAGFGNFAGANIAGGAGMTNNILGPEPTPGPGTNWPNLLDLLGPLIKGAGTALGGGGNNTTINNNAGGGEMDWMKWLLPILMATAGGLENRSQTSESTAKNTPTFDPKAQGYRDSLIDKFMAYTNQDPDLKGFEANQLSQMNRVSDLRQQNLAGDLAYRGISGPAAGLAQQNVDNQRFSDATQFRNTVPLLSQDLKQRALTSAGSFFNSIPYGTDVQSTNKQSGNVLGGITGGLAEALALMYGINQRRA